MTHISLNLDQNCRLNCVYCRRQDYMKRMNHSPKSFTQILKELDDELSKNKNAQFVSLLGGGEPTELDGFLDLCTELKRRKLFFNIETDGTSFHDEEYVKKLVDLGLSSIFMTFNSYIPSCFDYITQSKGYYDKVMLSLSNIQKYSIVIHFMIVILKCNMDHFYKVPFFIKQRFPKLNLKSFSFSIIRINHPSKIHKVDSFRYSEYSEHISDKIIKLSDYFDISLSTGAGSVPICAFPRIMIGNKFFPKNDENDNMHVKIEICKSCKLINDCPGIPNTYLEVYGDSEFKPF